VADDEAPSLARWINELAALPKIAASPYRSPLNPEPFGLGRPALVIPGMLSGDRSTSLLRRSLQQAGFTTFGWGRRWNAGVDPHALGELEGQIARIHEDTGQKVLVVGWSLGGLYARILAQRCASDVAMVVTLGTPFSGDRRANNAWRLYELLNDHTVDRPPIADDPSRKPDVPTIAIWSPRDGIVAPRSARGLPTQSDEQIELNFRHFELGCSRRSIVEILEVLRSRMAQQS